MYGKSAYIILMIKLDYGYLLSPQKGRNLQKISKNNYLLSWDNLGFKNYIEINNNTIQSVNTNYIEFNFEF